LSQRRKQKERKESRLVRDRERVVAFLRLLDGQKLTWAYNKGSRVVLLEYKDTLLRLTLKEYEDLVKALGRLLKEIEQ